MISINISKTTMVIGCLMLMSYQLKVHGQLQKRMDSIVKSYAAQGFNGNVLYSKNDSILYTGTYGYTNYKTKQLLNTQSLFELASVSKQFTAVAIVQLIEKGHFDYDTKVATLLPGFPYPSITIEHLLQHQSGLIDSKKLLYNKTYWNRKHKATSKDVLALLKHYPIDLNFTPGSTYEYSNTGYIILACIIETTSGLSYKQYIETHLFKPAHMSAAVVYENEAQMSEFTNIAEGYTYNQRKKRYQAVAKDKTHKHIHWMNTLVGDRGIYASMLDLELWKQAIRYNTLISASSKSRMFTTDRISKKYGFGWAIYNTESKGTWVYHNGSWSGYKTTAIYLPESNEYLVILSNNRFPETYKGFEDALYALICDY